MTIDNQPYDAEPIYDRLDREQLTALRAELVRAIAEAATCGEPRRYATLESRVVAVDQALRDRGERYVLHLVPGGPDAITCLTCHRTSYNAGDVEHHYCGHCKVFHDDAVPPTGAA